MPELIRVERIISGKGLIQIPTEYNNALDIFLYANLIRDSSNPSINFTWNPDKGFYAHITFCIDDYVLYGFDMNFKNQVWEIFTNQPSQNLLSLICQYDGILDSFVSVGNVIGITLSRTNLIKNHPYQRFRPNKIRFECFAECAIKLTLTGNELQKCNPIDGEETPPPPPPEPPTSLLPPTSPVEVSPPYEGENDGGDTVPFPIDSPPDEEFPVGEPCILFRVIFETVDGGGNVGEIVEIVFGVIDNVEIEGSIGNYSIFITCQGNASTGCIPIQRLQLSSYTGASITYLRTEPA
jgi:hypothetical protein